MRSVFYYTIEAESMEQTVKDICTWDVSFQFLCIYEPRKTAKQCNQGIVF